MRSKALGRLLQVTVFLLLALFLPKPLRGQGTVLSPALPLVHVDHGPNSAKAQQQHYVVLVSLDGFRWDYASRDNAAHLLALGKQGVWAPDGMLPSYPSLTFPNHFSIVTGLYPEHHGLVANNFLDPARQARYSISDAQGRHRRLLVQRHPLVEPCREPGHAHRLPLLARLRGRDRRLPAVLVRAVRRQDRGHASRPAGAHRRRRRPAPPACGRSPALHHHLLLRARPRRPPVRPRRP